MTSTEIAVAQSNGLDLNHIRNAAAIAGPEYSPAEEMLMKHARLLAVATEIATAMCKTSMVPWRFQGKPNEGVAAILYGMELNLSPIQSLQNVVNINGKPGIETRTMMAILRSKGYRFKTIEQTDERVTVWGQAPNGDEEEKTWTIERAIKARYVPQIDPETGVLAVNDKGKLIGNEKYLTDPQAMLYAKAGAEVCRQLAPEHLLGIAIDVDLMDAPDEAREPVKVKAERVETGADKIKERFGIKPDAAEVDDVPVAEAATEQSADAEAGKPIATAELRRLGGLLKQLDMNDPPNALAWISDAIGRDDIIGSTKDLTRAEGELVCAELRKLVDQRAAEAAKGAQS